MGACISEEGGGLGGGAWGLRFAEPVRHEVRRKVNFLTRGRAAAARLVHTQEVAGASPARATSFHAGPRAARRGARRAVGTCCLPRCLSVLIDHPCDRTAAAEASPIIASVATLSVVSAFARLAARPFARLHFVGASIVRRLNHAITLAWKGTKCCHRFASEKFAENVR